VASTLVAPGAGALNVADTGIVTVAVEPKSDDLANDALLRGLRAARGEATLSLRAGPRGCERVVARQVRVAEAHRSALLERSPTFQARSFLSTFGADVSAVERVASASRGH